MQQDRRPQETGQLGVNGVNNRRSLGGHEVGLLFVGCVIRVPPLSHSDMWHAVQSLWAI